MDSRLTSPASAAAAIIAAALLAAGCSGGSTSGGGLFGVSQPTETAPPPPDPMAKPIQVGWTLARAERCGFLFDKARVTNAYLAHEASVGATPERLQQAQTAMEYSRASTLTKIQSNQGYCSEDVLKALREDMPMVVAGNFNLPDRTPKAQPEGSLLDVLAVEPRGPEEFNRDKIFTPSADKGYE